MLEFNATFLVAMISFGIFMLLMNLILYKPLLEIVEKRKNLLEDNADEIRTNEQTAATLEANKNQALKEARVKVRQTVDEIAKNANKEREIEILDATSKAIQDLDNAKRELQQEVQVVKNELKGDVINFAQDITGKILNMDIAVSNVSDEKIDEVLNNGL